MLSKQQYNCLLNKPEHGYRLTILMVSAQYCVFVWWVFCYMYVYDLWAV